jgi:hypothetical protein
VREKRREKRKPVKERVKKEFERIGKENVKAVLTPFQRQELARKMKKIREGSK